MGPNNYNLLINRIFTLVAVCGFAVTIIINPNIQDPINSPKMWAITFFASILLSFYIFIIEKRWFKSPSKVIGFCFIVSILWSYIFTQNKLIGFTGDVQRKNGALSYLSLVIIWILICHFANWSIEKKIRYSVTVTSCVVGIYGFLQVQGIDFIKWNNPYNRVIATLGNPNFSAAIMAIFITFLFPYLFAKKLKINTRIFIVCLMLLLLYTLVQTTARQGLIALATGLTISLYFLFISKMKKFRIFYILVSVIVGILVCLGMLQKGPISTIVYKDSVSVRGFYWRAAFKMFENNILKGIGLDSYGYFFRQYREVEYPLRYGFDITSTNAHNVFLQQFATGGVFLGVVYLSLVFYTGYRALKLLSKEYFEENSINRIFSVSLVSAWVAFQSQSVISIDTLSISVWGWIVSGTIIGLSYQENTKHVQLVDTSSKLKSKILIQPIIALSFLIPTLIFLSILIRVETFSYNVTSVLGNIQQLDSKSTDELNYLKASRFTDPAYLVNIATQYTRISKFKEAEVILTEIIKKDSLNQDALNVLSFIYERTGRFSEAIKLRESIYELNPWGADNLYKLGLDYKQLGLQTKVLQIRLKILDFATDTEIGKLTKANLN